jgi:formylglycine-generating enzyme required for sulfatase activity
VALLSLRRSRSFCEDFFREMLAAGIAENNPDLAERCLTEALYFEPRPFIEALKEPRPKKTTALGKYHVRLAAILRLLRDRSDQVPELEELSQRFAESDDQETREYAMEILARRGGETQVAMAEKGVFVDERSGIAFVTIRAGEFDMGSDRGHSDERPVHRVRISRDFLLGKYPVTNAQYAKFLEFLEAADKRVRKPQHWHYRRFNQAEQPVVGVSWNEAQAFCEWVGGRLPTEAEWEYACRAGTRTEYSFGEDAELLGEHGWSDRNSNNQPQPVGSKKPNPWGLYDMHGNVWEWCQDWFSEEYYAESPELDPQGPEEATHRVGRGGSWAGGAGGCRSAFRGLDHPADRNRVLGFRVAAVPPGQSSQEKSNRQAEPGA